MSVDEVDALSRYPTKVWNPEWTCADGSVSYSCV